MWLKHFHLKPNKKSALLKLKCALLQCGFGGMLLAKKKEVAISSEPVYKDAPKKATLKVEKKLTKLLK
jgi:hypothetical protein